MLIICKHIANEPEIAPDIFLILCMTSRRLQIILELKLVVIVIVIVIQFWTGYF